MTYYKHYSFDLWLTLIKSNPLFKKERTKIFHERFNPHTKSLDEVALIFRQVDLMVNAINERTGKNIDADEMYLMVINMISNFSNDFKTVDIELVYEEMEELLFKYMPIIYSDETISTLAHLKKNVACTINILSNTGFIRGRTLRKILKQIGLSEFFDFQLYSDEEGLSKPNTELFKLMLQRVSGLGTNCSLTDVLHIGDNPEADIKGAEIAGIHGLLINSNNVSINTLICQQP
ncbi:MAG: family hydrolase [Sphingobacteriales bacterium]|nr:family hydrolase [Sphingobacteriales bacterium]